PGWRWNPSPGLPRRRADACRPARARPGRQRLACRRARCGAQLAATRLSGRTSGRVSAAADGRARVRAPGGGDRCDGRAGGRRGRRVRRHRRPSGARVRLSGMGMPDELATPRLRLRPYRWQDLDDIMAYATSANWARYLPVPWPYSRRDGERFLASQVLLDREREPCWAIEIDGHVVGGVNLRLSP